MLYESIYMIGSRKGEDNLGRKILTAITSRGARKRE